MTIGKARGQQGTKQQHQDDERGEQAGALGGAARALLGAPDGVAAQFDPQAVAGRILSGVDDGADVGAGDVLRLAVERDRGIGDRPVAGDRRRAGVRAKDTCHVRQVTYLAQHGRDPRLRLRRTHPARVGHHDLHRGARLRRGVLLQRVECLLRLSPWKREVVVVVAALPPGRQQ